MRLRKQAVRSHLHPFYYVLCQHLCRRAINKDKPLLENIATDYRSRMGKHYTLSPATVYFGLLPAIFFRGVSASEENDRGL